MKHFVAGVAFAIPELWESSTLAKLDERKDSIALDFEPLNLQDEGHELVGISKDLDLQLPDLSSFAYGPIEDLGALDASSVVSAADSFEDLETVDIWSFPHDLEEQKAILSRSWETFFDKTLQEPRTAYISENGPQALDAVLAAHDGNTKDDGLGTKPGYVIEPTALVSSLLQLGFGRESVLFRYEEYERSFVPLIGNRRVSGYSLETVQNLSATFLEYGNTTKRLQYFIDEIQNSRKSLPTSIALAASISVIIATLHAQIGDPSTSAHDLLQIKSMFERPGFLLSCLNDIIIGVHEARIDEELLSRLFEYLQDSEHSEHSGFRPAVFHILASVSQPWLDSVGKWVGLKGDTATESDALGQTFGDKIQRLEGGREAKKLEQDSEHLQMPKFISEEDSRIIFRTGKSLRLLKKYSPGHPLSRPTQADSVGTPDLDWQFSWRDIENLQLQVQEYEANLHKAILDFDLHGGNPKAHLHKETVTHVGIAEIGLSKEMANAYIHASIATFEKPLPDLKTERSNKPSSKCIYNNFPEENNLTPPLSVLPVLSFNPVIASQALFINRACLRLLFKEHNIMSHFSLLCRYSLFGDGVFASRLSHALFDPELNSSERGKSEFRTGISGLKLGSRDTWPPASSELRLALMGILTESYYESGQGAEGSSGFREELPGGLSFAIRDMPEDELQRCMDPNSIGALDFLMLQYKPPPPLDAVITQASLAKYDVVFKLLLRAVRMLFVANQLFRDTKSRSAMIRAADPISEIFRIESHHFISAICRYLFNGVQAYWELLQRRLTDIDKALNRNETSHGDSLDKLRDFHEDLLDGLMSALLLNKRQAQVMKLLEDIFGLILLFARHARTETNPDVAHLGFKIDVKEMYEKFEKKVREFIGVCRGLSERRGEDGAASHDANEEFGEGGNTIGRLLLEFDMSGFYAK